MCEICLEGIEAAYSEAARKFVIAKHTANQQTMDYRRFTCGAEVLWRPAFSDYTVRRLCQRSDAYQEMQRQLQAITEEMRQLNERKERVYSEFKSKQSGGSV